MGLCTASTSARAEAPREQGSYVYVFDDPPLSMRPYVPEGCVPEGFVPEFPAPRPRRNVFLVRPRIHFVRELLRTIETM
jgi:hypothetical protein